MDGDEGAHVRPLTRIVAPAAAARQSKRLERCSPRKRAYIPGRPPDKRMERRARPQTLAVELTVQNCDLLHGFRSREKCEFDLPAKLATMEVLGRAQHCAKGATCDYIRRN